MTCATPLNRPAVSACVNLLGPQPGTHEFFNNKNVVLLKKFTEKKCYKNFSKNLLANLQLIMGNRGSNRKPFGMSS